MGPLNPLTTLLHIQGVPENGAPVILFVPADILGGQLDRVDDSRMVAVGPLRFRGGAYAVVPEGEAYAEEMTGLQGEFITYNPDETTAREALNQWFLDNVGWYADAEEAFGVFRVVDEGGEVVTGYDARELNRFWANEYGLHFEMHRDSIFAEIERLVQRVFWRFYRPSRPEDEEAMLWQRLVELLDELIEEEWDDVAQGYLANYRTLLGVWYQAYGDPRFDAGLYVPPSLPVNAAFDQIDRLLDSAEDPFMWPTGRMTVFEGPIPVGGAIRIEGACLY